MTTATRARPVPVPDTRAIATVSRSLALIRTRRLRLVFLRAKHCALGFGRCCCRGKSMRNQGPAQKTCQESGFQWEDCWLLAAAVEGNNVASTSEDIAETGRAVLASLALLASWVVQVVRVVRGKMSIRSVLVTSDRDDSENDDNEFEGIMTVVPFLHKKRKKKRGEASGGTHYTFEGCPELPSPCSFFF